MTTIRLDNVSVLRGERYLLKQVTVEFSPGELTVILGPNGAGKSTLLRSAIGYINNNNGLSYIDDVDSRKITLQQKVLKLAYMPQQRTLAWPITTFDMVALGRFAYGVNLAKLTVEDRHQVQQALKICRIEHLSRRRTNTLSGGELARAHCAQIFATQAPMIIADEPIAALDPRHQYLIMKYFAEYVARGNGAVIVLHDPVIAANFAHRLVWLKDGQIVADGNVEQTLTERHLAQVYDMDARVTTTNGIHTIAFSKAL